MTITRRVINKCALVKPETDPKLKYAWGQPEDKFEFYYYNRKVATLAFESSKNRLMVCDVFDPWSYVLSYKGELLLTRINKFEDELHGVDVIESDILEALYEEWKVNDTVKAARIKTADQTIIAGKSLTAQAFSDILTSNYKDAYIANIRDLAFKTYGNSVMITGIK